MHKNKVEEFSMKYFYVLLKACLRTEDLFALAVDHLKNLQQCLFCRNKFDKK
jgi:hypothetical protein